MTITIDPLQVLVVIAIVLMMVGVIHFTPVAIGALLIGTYFELKFKFEL